MNFLAFRQLDPYLWKMQPGIPHCFITVDRILEVMMNKGEER